MQYKNWSKASMSELVDHIQQEHCRIRQELVKAHELLSSAAALCKDERADFTVLQEFLPVLNSELEKHFEKEEQILFPYIRQMDDYSQNRGSKPEFHNSSIKNPISQLEYDHIQVEGVMLKKLHEITSGFSLPQESGENLKQLYINLKNLTAMISEHIGLEQSTLFPEAIEMELHLRHKN